MKNFGEKGAWAYPGTAHFLFIPGTRKATNFKFDRYIHRVHPSKSPFKIWEKMSVGVSRDCPNFLSTPIRPISGTGKATNFQFCTHVLIADYKFRGK